MRHRGSRTGWHVERIGIVLGLILGIALWAFWPVSAVAQQQTPSTLPGQTTPTTPQNQVPGGGIQSDRQFVEVRAFSNLTRITGEARDRSFLTDGNNSAVDFSYLENFSLGVRELEAASILRYTDDRRVDPERNSVQRAYLRISGPRSEYNFGDYLVNYSRLSYNQNLKGVHFMRSVPSMGHGFRLLGNVGVFTDRYGSIFKEDLPGKPFTRLVSGLRAEQNVDTDKTLALTWAFGNDLEDSIAGTTPFVPVANNVLSLDARMLFARIWEMQAEVAYSMTDPDTRVASGTRKDYALRFDNSIRAGRWTANFYYTRIMPSFKAINARQVADLQDAMIRAGVDLSDQVFVQGIYRRTNDDLRGENLNPATVFQMPEIRFSFRNLPGLGSARLDVGYRERRQDQSTVPARQFAGADRVTRTPFFEINIPISSTVLGFAYEHRDLGDNLDPTNETAANDFSVSLQSIFDVGNWTFSPVLRYEHNREIFDRVDTGNNNRNIRAFVVIEAPKYLVFEGLFRQVGATLFQDRRLRDPDTLEPVVGRDGLPEFEVAGPAGFRRPSYRVALTFKLFNDENRRITFSFERNNNLFAVSGQDFLERVMQLAVTWRFQRQ